MPRGKSKDPKPWERLLQVMVNGEPIQKDQVQNAINYEFMYRMSSLILEIKLHGGTIKVVKDGRKVVSYQLANPTEMMKYLSDRGFSPIQMNVKSEKVEKLSDLNSQPVEPVAKKFKKSKTETVVAEIVVEEVTE
jgi:hypothetical protein